MRDEERKYIGWELVTTNSLRIINSEIIAQMARIKLDSRGEFQTLLDMAIKTDIQGSIVFLRSFDTSTENHYERGDHRIVA